MTDPAPLEAVSRFVERFASLLTDAGMPRMPARVMMALMVTESGALTAAELAEMLQVSPAAVSGAVRYLTRVHLAVREREPGSRRDIFRVRDDEWQDAITNRGQMLKLWEQGMHEGIVAVGDGTQAAHRLAVAMEYYAYLREELDGMRERWHDHLAGVRAGKIDPLSGVSAAKILRDDPADPA